MEEFKLRDCPFCGKNPFTATGGSYISIYCKNPECWIQPKAEVRLDMNSDDFTEVKNALRDSISKIIAIWNDRQGEQNANSL